MKILIANPPYLNGKYKSILREIIECVDDVVFVSPLGYLKDKDADAKSLQAVISKYYTRICLINPKDYFNADAVGFAGFTYIDKTREASDIVTSIDGIDGSVTHHSLKEIIGYASFSPVLNQLNTLS